MLFFMQANTEHPRAILSTLTSPSSIRVLRKADLGFVDRGWTRGHMTCSFDDMPKNAPGYLEYGDLKLAVIENMDAGAGYAMHAHKWSETISILLSGAVAHADSIDRGTKIIAGPNDVAVASAGAALAHEEMTHGSENAHIVMFWLKCAEVPKDDDRSRARFTKRTFDRASRKNRFVTLASGRDNACPLAMPMVSDASVSSAMLDPHQEVRCTFDRNRRGYILAPYGAIEVNGERAEPGDRVLVTGTGGPREVVIRALAAATEVIVLDLP
jgi:quercetin 2,3-dioxygenase